MKMIQLTHGKVGIVDDEDFAELSKYKWRISNSGYAIRWPSRTLGNPRSTIFMHKEVLKISRNESGDHVNRDRLDNRRINLRVATPSQNMANRIVSSGNKLGVKGIRFDAERNKYRARAKLNGIEVHLGRFETLEEAQLAYVAGAKKLHGEFARTK